MAIKYQKREEWSTVLKYDPSGFSEQLLYDLARGMARATRQDYNRSVKAGVRSSAMGRLEKALGYDNNEVQIKLPRGKNKYNKEVLTDMIVAMRDYLNNTVGGGVSTARAELARFNEALGRNNEELNDDMDDDEYSKHREFTYAEREQFWNIYNEVCHHGRHQGSPDTQMALADYIVENPGKTKEEYVKWLEDYRNPASGIAVN